MTVADGDDDLAEVEARARLRKLDLEIEKLTLDKKLAEHQLTATGIALDWLKAGSVFVALIGIAVTLFMGQSQLRASQEAAESQARQAEDNLAAERFDKALSHLADRANVGERLTGVAGLRLLLRDRSESHQTEALQHLIIAIVHEPSFEVRQAILDAVSDAASVGQNAKDEALRSAVEIDRSLTEEYVNSKLASNGQAERVLYASLLGKPVKTVPEELGKAEWRALNFSQALQLENLEVEDLFPAKDTTDSDSFALNDIIKILELLIGSGARNPSKDWRGIYCPGCVFTAARDLSGQHFDRAFLSGANFAHMNLRGSTFANADIAGAIFFDSDLSGADLSQVEDRWVMTTHPRYYYPYPSLECATLNGANLTDLPLGYVKATFNGPYQTPAAGDIEFRFPAVAMARADAHTKMDGFAMGVDFTYDKERLTSHLKDHGGVLDEYPTFFDEFWRETAVGHFDNYWRSAKHVWFDFGSDHEVNRSGSSTIVLLGAANEINGWARRGFASTLAQPFWKALPATARILDKAGLANADPASRHRQAPGYRCSQSRVPEELIDSWSYSQAE